MEREGEEDQDKDGWTHARRFIAIEGGDGVADPVCDPTFCSWGFGGRCKPPPPHPEGGWGWGGAPEENAFWQQSIQIWLKIRSLDRRLHP